ncbi:MAG TPA: ABC-2 family transporter protein [Kofleriaceae bacterium]|nr:ABC-2 family transporter protein [Kofleriaceae bacterium]
MRVRYHLRVLGVSARASLVTSMQYRADFLVQGAMAIAWTAIALVPLLVLYDQRTTVAGWGFGPALLVIGMFTIMRGVLEGAINPSLLAVVERIRNGSFDYTLLKPADAQFLVSTTRFELWRAVDVTAGLGVLAWGFVEIGHAPAPLDVAAALVLLLGAMAVMYSLWILIVAAAFWVVRLDNLTYLLGAIFDAGRWPIQIFRGAWRVIFTIVIPLALMTTYPAMALRGVLAPATGAACLGGAAAFFVLSRGVWLLALRGYTSASS